VVLYTIKKSKYIETRVLYIGTYRIDGQIILVVLHNYDICYVNFYQWCNRLNTLHYVVCEFETEIYLNYTLHVIQHRSASVYSNNNII